MCPPIFSRLRKVLAVARSATRYPVEWDDEWTDEGRVLVVQILGVPAAKIAEVEAAVRNAVVAFCWDHSVLMNFVTDATPRRPRARKRPAARRRASVK